MDKSLVPRKFRERRKEGQAENGRRESVRVFFAKFCHISLSLSLFSLPISGLTTTNLPGYVSECPSQFKQPNEECCDVLNLILPRSSYLTFGPSERDRKVGVTRYECKNTQAFNKHIIVRYTPNRCKQCSPFYTFSCIRLKHFKSFSHGTECIYFFSGAHQPSPKTYFLETFKGRPLH